MKELSIERKGEIAMIVLRKFLEDSGKLHLEPKKISKQISQSSKELNLSKAETALFVKDLMEDSFKETMEELNKIIEKD